MFQKGNKLAARSKLFGKELQKVLTQSPNKLRAIAEKLVAKAEEGDMLAIREIADRLDGKAHQTVHATVEHTVETGDASSLETRLASALHARAAPGIQ
jgi:hypothetical protein